MRRLIAMLLVCCLPQVLACGDDESPSGSSATASATGSSGTGGTAGSGGAGGAGGAGGSEACTPRSGEGGGDPGVTCCETDEDCPSFSCAVSPAECVCGPEGRCVQADTQ